MGAVEVPAGALWGPQTQRAVENFRVSGQRMHRLVIEALGRVKAAAAQVNGEREDVPQVSPELARAIVEAASEVADGRFDDQFPVDVFQTGSGTSTNMNANEVIASLAGELLGAPGSVHPNDHVNASQSSNDVFPTAVHVAALLGLERELLPELVSLRAALLAKAQELSGVVKAGRTHLMDAVPLTLGAELSSYAAQLGECLERIEGARDRLGRVPLGGTAVGTGLNTPPGFAPEAVARLAEMTGLALSPVPERLALQAAHDTLVEVSGHLRVLAVALQKIATDVAWMASGPAAGLAEISIPELQPGSSMMPGKVNPVMTETVRQVAAQVVGNDSAVAWAGSQGHFELNTAGPVMAHNLLESIDLLASAMRLFRERCVEGIQADAQRCRRYAESSPAVATALTPKFGYERVAALVRMSLESGRTIRETALAEGLLTADELDMLVDLEAMARPQPLAGTEPEEGRDESGRKDRRHA